ncbi:hypothetical protein NL676_007382 [Syzygium grande]|nr:hypothetical protein NL676_007382 [Syzygium grande]
MLNLTCGRPDALAGQAAARGLLRTCRRPNEGWRVSFTRIATVAAGGRPRPSKPRRGAGRSGTNPVRRGTGRPFPHVVTPGPPSSRKPLSARVAHHLAMPNPATTNAGQRVNT